MASILPRRTAQIYRSLDIKPCPHGEKYTLEDSTLLQYLMEDCKGFQIDPEGKYTLNYVITVLLANWKEKQLIQHCTVLTNGRIKRAFGTYDSCFCLTELRAMVLRYFDTKEFFLLEGYYRIYRAPLWCLDSSLMEQLQAEIGNCNYPSSCDKIKTFKCENNIIPRRFLGPGLHTLF